MKHLNSVPVVILLMIASVSVSQQCYSQQSIYAELLGNGIALSVNYDYVYSNGLGWRAGVGLATFDRENGASIPVTFHYVLGATHQVEFGLGMVYSGMDSDVYPISSIAYRYRSDVPGVLFRLAANPLRLLAESLPPLDIPAGKGVGLPISFSLGYAF